MKSKYTPNEKQDVISRHQDGQSVTQISQETGVPKSTIYAWLKGISCNTETPNDFTQKISGGLKRR